MLNSAKCLSNIFNYIYRNIPPNCRDCGAIIFDIMVAGDSYVAFVHNKRALAVVCKINIAGRRLHICAVRNRMFYAELVIFPTHIATHIVINSVSDCIIAIGVQNRALSRLLINQNISFCVNIFIEINMVILMRTLNICYNCDIRFADNIAHCKQLKRA